MEKAEHRKPAAPQNHFIHVLHIHHTKDEDKLVEDKVPELVLHVLKGKTENNKI